MWVRGMREDPAGRTGDIAVRAYKAVVQDVAFHVFAQASGIRRPDAARHLRFVDQSRRTRHHLHHPIDAVDKTIARGWILMAENAVRARATLTRMRLLCFKFITNMLLRNINTYIIIQASLYKLHNYIYYIYNYYIIMTAVLFFSRFKFIWTFM